MKMGERLRQARKTKGYTQEALAAAIGVSRGVITNIEYDKAETQPLFIRAICETLEINEQWLVSGEGEMDAIGKSEKSARLLSAIYSAAKGLSVQEQDYILDMIRTFQKHRENIVKGKDE